MQIISTVFFKSSRCVTFLLPLKGRKWKSSQQILLVLNPLDVLLQKYIWILGGILKKLNPVVLQETSKHDWNKSIYKKFLSKYNTDLLGTARLTILLSSICSDKIYQHRLWYFLYFVPSTWRPNVLVSVTEVVTPSPCRRL